MFTSAAMFLIAVSSAISATKTDTSVLVEMLAFVSSRVEAVRPIRISFLAPAVANACAVARPIPVPWRI